MGNLWHTFAKSVKKYPWVLIFLTALFVRIWIADQCLDSLAFVSNLHANYENESICYTADSPRYERLGWNILRNGSFSAGPITPFSGELPGGSPPELYRTPLYPLTLAFIFGLFGYTSYPIIIFQIILSSFTAVLIWKLAKNISDENLAFFSGIFFAIYPRTGLHSAQIMSETLFTFLFSIFLLTGFSFFERPSITKGFLVGAGLAALALTRQVGLFLPITLIPAVISLVFFSNKAPRKKVAQAVLTIGIVFLSITCVWYLRNLKVYGEWYFSTLSDYNIAFFLTPWVLQQKHAVPEGAAIQLFADELCERHPDLNNHCRELYKNPEYRWTLVENLDVNKKAGPIAREILLSEWKISIPGFAGGAFWSLWSGVGEWRSILITAEQYDSIVEPIKQAKTHLYRGDMIGSINVLFHDILTTLSFTTVFVFSFIWLMSITIYLLSIPGLIALYKKNVPFSFGLLLIMVYFFAAAGPAANNRQIVPIYTIICLLAAMGLPALKNKLSRINPKSTTIA